MIRTPPCVEKPSIGSGAEGRVPCALRASSTMRSALHAIYQTEVDCANAIGNANEVELRKRHRSELELDDEPDAEVSNETIGSLYDFITDGGCNDPAREKFEILETIFSYQDGQLYRICLAFYRAGVKGDDFATRLGGLEHWSQSDVKALAATLPKCVQRPMDTNDEWDDGYDTPPAWVECTNCDAANLTPHDCNNPCPFEVVMAKFKLSYSNKAHCALARSIVNAASDLSQCMQFSEETSDEELTLATTKFLVEAYYSLASDAEVTAAQCAVPRQTADTLIAYLKPASRNGTVVHDTIQWGYEFATRLDFTSKRDIVDFTNHQTYMSVTEDAPSWWEDERETPAAKALEEEVEIHNLHFDLLAQAEEDVDKLRAHAQFFAPGAADEKYAHVIKVARVYKFLVEECHFSSAKVTSKYADACIATDYAFDYCVATIDECAKRIKGLALFFQELLRALHPSDNNTRFTRYKHLTYPTALIRAAQAARDNVPETARCSYDSVVFTLYRAGDQLFREGPVLSVMRHGNAKRRKTCSVAATIH